MIKLSLYYNPRRYLMITNTYIPLDPNSPIRMDALNTIKYTLMLDYKIPESDNMDNLIDDIMENCRKCCNGLFTEKEDLPITFDFFGHLLSGKQPDSLFYLNDYLPSAKFTDIPSFASIPSMILHHCILSSYHAILTELLHNYQVTSYTMENNIKTYGFQSLRKIGLTLLEDHKVRFKGQKENTKCSKKSSTASDFFRVVNSHKDIDPLSNIMKLMISSKSEDSSKYKYSLQFSELCYRICQIKAADWKKIKMPSQLEVIKNITESMEPHGTSFEKIYQRKDFNGNPTDTLYHYYLTERIFNFSLFFSLLENIKQIEDKTNYRFNQEYIISILCLCKELPNVFSRQIFLKYAFGQIESEPGSFYDFWSRNKYEKRYTMAEISKNPKGFQFPQWIEQYKLFFQYFSVYIIPVYEWCFINMLMESIEKSFLKGDHTQNLYKALELLTKYIEKHSQTIMKPIQSEKNVLDYIEHNLKYHNTLPNNIKQIIQNKETTLDMITDHKSPFYLESISEDFVNQIIHSLLLSSEDLELNIPLLNPNFFKDVKNYKPISNSSSIRKFYLDLVYSTYLK